MSQHITLGQRGEHLAAKYLEQHGYRLLERNWRCQAGEIDIVAELDGLLVIVEVKTRRTTDCGHPLEALTPTKIARLYRLAVLWSVNHEWRGAFRIDALAVVVDTDTHPQFDHLIGLQ